MTNMIPKISIRLDLMLDPTRELSVSDEPRLFPDRKAQEQVEETISMSAGFDAEIEEVFETVEPDLEKTFEIMISA